MSLTFKKKKFKWLPRPLKVKKKKKSENPQNHSPCPRIPFSIWPCRTLIITFSSCPDTSNKASFGGSKAQRAHIPFFLLGAMFPVCMSFLARCLSFKINFQGGLPWAPRKESFLILPHCTLFYSWCLLSDIAMLIIQFH